MAKTTLASYYQRGENIDYTNSTDETIPANAFVVVGSLAGVTGTEIPPHGVGSLHIEGVFSLPKKKSEKIEMGSVVVFTDDAVEKAGEEGTEAPIGIVIAEAAAEDETVLVKINTNAAKAAAASEAV